MRWLRLLPCLTVVWFVTACARRTGPDPHLDEAYPSKLSGWRLFEKGAKPAVGVLAYDVITPLFSNYAAKHRTVWMPSGAKAKYRAQGAFEFPIGTVLTKTFGYPREDGSERLIETRLLVKQRSGWIALVYVWDRDGRDATLEPSPEPVPVKWVDPTGKERSAVYDIPNVNQCAACHKDGEPLGPTARNVDAARWTAAGYLTGAPSPEPNSPTTLEDRARAYLDVNCSSCHREGTRAKPLDLARRDEIVRRMESLDPEKRMPTIGRTVVHSEGVSLIREWSRSLR